MPNFPAAFNVNSSGDLLPTVHPLQYQPSFLDYLSSKVQSGPFTLGARQRGGGVVRERGIRQALRILG